MEEIVIRLYHKWCSPKIARIDFVLASGDRFRVTREKRKIRVEALK